MGVFRYLLYAAVAASLSVYAYRAYRRWIAPRPDAAAGSDAPADASGSAAPALPATPAPPPSRPARAATTAGGAPAADAPAQAPRTKRGLGFTDPYSLPSEREQAGSESLVQQVIREELARKQGVDPDAAPSPESSAPARTGLFAGGAGDPRPADRVSVAAALTGLRLPDDLVPLVGDARHADPHHVTFISSAESAAVIGRHLGDELERLGFAVRSESDVVAVATKGSVTLRVTLHPNAGTERLDGAARYPTAGPASVVVEFET